ncbi:MAG: PRC-barrel domain-containing protein [archaeon]
MSETSQKRHISSQKIIGMQVIDEKGAVIGNVKDVVIDLAEKQLILNVTTKEKTDLEISGSMIKSVEDVVLLTTERPPLTGSTPEGTVPLSTTITCPNCKTILPAHAKFCAKCGSKIPS